MSLDSVLQHIQKQFERAHKLHELSRSTHRAPEISLADKAAPIFRRITATPGEHRRTDGLVYEIVEPNVHDLNTLFEEALVSLGFKREVVTRG